MIDCVQRVLYGKCWLFFHTLFSILISFMLVAILALLRLDINILKSLINNDTVSISAELAGFVFAGMSIFISLDGNKKMSTIKKVGKDNIIYCILILSIVLLVLSVVLMLIDINVLNDNNIVTIQQSVVKDIIQWISLYCMLSGFLYFMSSLQIVFWIFKK